MLERPNYYELLELDPAERDLEAIRRRIEVRQHDWGRRCRQAAAEQRGRWVELLSRCDEMRDLLENPEFWREEARRARERLDEALRQANDLIGALKVNRRTYDEEVVASIVKATGDRLTEYEVDRRLRKEGLRRLKGDRTLCTATVNEHVTQYLALGRYPGEVIGRLYSALEQTLSGEEIREAFRGAGLPSEEEVDAVRQQALEIHGDLAAAEKASIYEVLGVRTDTPAAQLRRHCTEVAGRLADRVGAGNPVGCARLELARRYQRLIDQGVYLPALDQAIIDCKMELKNVSSMMAAMVMPEGVLTVEGINQLLALAQAAGVEEDDALGWIRRAMKSNGWRSENTARPQAFAPSGQPVPSGTFTAPVGPTPSPSLARPRPQPLPPQRALASGRLRYLVTAVVAALLLGGVGVLSRGMLLTMERSGETRRPGAALATRSSGVGTESGATALAQTVASTALPPASPEEGTEPPAAALDLIGDGSRRLNAVQATASSEYESGDRRLPASNVMDSDLTSAWCEGASSDGSGEWVSLALAGEPLITGVSIFNGYQQHPAGSWDRFLANGRVRDATIKVGGNSLKVRLKDRKGEQQFKIEPPVFASMVTLTIGDVYLARYKDTCVSEVRLWGSGGAEVTVPRQSRAEIHVAPASVTASAWLHQDRIQVTPSQAIDSHQRTAWCVKGGPGQWLKLTLSSTTRVSAIEVVNGYDKAGAWESNNRVERLGIKAGGVAIERRLLSTRRAQRVSLGDSVEAGEILLTIKSVFRGSRHDDTCLSEVRVLGPGARGER